MAVGVGALIYLEPALAIEEEWTWLHPVIEWVEEEDQSLGRGGEGEGGGRGGGGEVA